jgi:hypothetical protein
MDTEQYRYQRFCSDISGVDISSHGDDPAKLVRVVRNWLRTNIDPSEGIPGGDHMFARYRKFLQKLPELCHRVNLDPASIIYPDYISLLQGWLQGNDWRLPTTAP